MTFLKQKLVDLVKDTEEPKHVVYEPIPHDLKKVNYKCKGNNILHILSFIGYRPETRAKTCPFRQVVPSRLRKKHRK